MKNGTITSDALRKIALSTKSLRRSPAVCPKYVGSLAVTSIAIGAVGVFVLYSCGTATLASTFASFERPTKTTAGTSSDISTNDPPSNADAGVALASMNTAESVATAVINTVFWRPAASSRRRCPVTLSSARESSIVAASGPVATRGSARDGTYPARLLPDEERWCMVEVAGAKPSARGSSRMATDARRMFFEAAAVMEDAARRCLIFSVALQIPLVCPF
mmetsp:Transcript_47603/g.113343  ORF Transcript_47603/g.113343 Transcript_47603/m.113343 type:complete len:220 (+) Transcript_47603:238-897(+)|eukprot:CAMPEP_0180137192 /NCGR_PEP_ID=MMETSP0986-20121125/12046_1 /TAXON_ID=697907 /ORGANISM="non described non described, Strain CCMP2293" /LENGTH=219 /DNA_ID=CAMNT_0022078567 /DNA_START=267 /DNA_END=926 /DNA_ORIENTATION=-